VALAAHGFTNDRKGLLPDRLAGHDVIRSVKEAEMAQRREAPPMKRPPTLLQRRRLTKGVSSRGE
jgi:hypothetical protein